MQICLFLRRCQVPIEIDATSRILLSHEAACVSSSESCWKLEKKNRAGLCVTLDRIRVDDGGCRQTSPCKLSVCLSPVEV